MSRAISDTPAPTYPARGAEILQGAVQTYLRGPQDLIYCGASAVWRQDAADYEDAVGAWEMWITAEAVGTRGVLRFSYASDTALPGEIALRDPDGNLVWSDTLATAVGANTFISAEFTRAHDRYRVSLEWPGDLSLTDLVLEWARETIGEASGELAYSDTETIGNSPLSAATINDHLTRCGAVYYALRQLYTAVSPRLHPYYCPAAHLPWRRWIYVRAVALGGGSSTLYLETLGGTQLAEWDTSDWVSVEITQGLEWVRIVDEDAEVIRVDGICMVGRPGAYQPWAQEVAVGGGPYTTDLPHPGRMPPLGGLLAHIDHAPAIPSSFATALASDLQGAHRDEQDRTRIYLTIWGTGAPVMPVLSTVTQDGGIYTATGSGLAESSAGDGYWYARIPVFFGPQYADRGWAPAALSVESGSPIQSGVREVIAMGIEWWAEGRW